MFLVGGTHLMAAKVGEQGVGIEVGTLKSDATATVNGVSGEGDLDTSFQAIKFGKYYEFGRLGASVGMMNKDRGTDGYFVGGAYDYMFYNNSQFVPFVGASVGYSWNKANYDIGHDGFIYGIEAGLVYEASKEIDLEIGARYFKTNIEGSKTVSGVPVKIDVDSTTHYYLSVSYKF